MHFPGSSSETWLADPRQSPAVDTAHIAGRPQCPVLSTKYVLTCGARNEHDAMADDTFFRRIPWVPVLVSPRIVADDWQIAHASKSLGATAFSSSGLILSQPARRTCLRSSDVSLAPLGTHARACSHSGTAESSGLPTRSNGERCTVATDPHRAAGCQRRDLLIELSRRRNSWNSL